MLIVRSHKLMLADEFIPKHLRLPMELNMASNDALGGPKSAKKDFVRWNSIGNFTLLMILEKLCFHSYPILLCLLDRCDSAMNLNNILQNGRTWETEDKKGKGKLLSWCSPMWLEQFPDRKYLPSSIETIQHIHSFSSKPSHIVHLSQSFLLHLVHP